MTDSEYLLLLFPLKYTGIFLQHLFCFISKIQKYSPSESAKVYDKAINRKAGIHFHPKQTLDFLRSDMANSRLTEDVKRNIVKQYLDVSFHYLKPHYLLLATNGDHVTLEHCKCHKYNWHSCQVPGF